MVRKTISFGNQSNREDASAEVGDLILYSYSDGERNAKAPILGIFGDFVHEDYLCLADTPLRLEVVKLPSGLYHANFVPIVLGGFHNVRIGARSTTIEQATGFERVVTAKRISELDVGLSSIVRKLKSDPEHKYNGHIDVIEEMQEPYVNDPNMRRKLGLR